MKKKQKQHFTGKKWIAALVVVVLILAAIYYYIALPAINIHNPELWKFVLFLAVIIFALYALPKTTFTGDRRHPVNFSGNYKTKTFKFLASLVVVIAAAYFVGTLLSSPIINASKYQKLMKIEKVNLQRILTRFLTTRSLCLISLPQKFLENVRWEVL